MEFNKIWLSIQWMSLNLIDNWLDPCSGIEVRDRHASTVRDTNMFCETLINKSFENFPDLVQRG
jgi:hypothetical protein